MLGHALLVLLLVQVSIQGGVRPQSGTLARLAPSRGAALGGAGIGVKPGGAGVLGARGYGGGKAGVGRYLGAGGYRPLGTRGGLKQGFAPPLAGYGAGLGASMGPSMGTGLGTGLGAGLGASLGQGLGLSNGLAVGLAPQAGKLGGRGYTSNYGLQPGYGAVGYPGRGYSLGMGSYPAAGLANGYGMGLGPAVYPQAGKVGKQTGFGSLYGFNGYSDGYGAELGYPAALAEGAGLGAKAGLGAGGFGSPGLGLGLSSIPDAKAGKYGGATPGSVLGAAGGHPVMSAGLGPQGKAGSYGGAPYVGQTPTGLGPDSSLGAGVLEPVTGGDASQLPYNGAPVIPAGLEGDIGYSYGPQQLGLGNDGGKLSQENGKEYRAQPAGYGVALGLEGQGSYGANKDASQYGLGGFYGNRVKG